MVSSRDFELRHLLALDAVAATGTFGRAAERLGYTQSAVSQQIAALERAVGEPLFDRPGGPKPVALTPLGTVLLAHAHEILERVDAAAADVGRFQAGVIGRVDIGTFQSVSTGILPPVLGMLRAERPHLEARLFESEDELDLARRVIEGALDVSFLLGHTPPELDVVELFVDPFVLVALPADVGDGPVPIATLGTVPLIGEQDNACQQRIDASLRTSGIDPDYVFRTNDNAAVLAMVRAGMGMAVMPRLAVDPDDRRIAVRELDPPIAPRHITIGWRRDRTLSPVARRVVELAREMTSQLRTLEFASAG